MGQVCSPKDDQTENHSNVEVDVSTDKFSTVISEYVAENEELKRQLDKYKNENERKKEHEERAKKNEKVMNELSAMRALLESKNQELVKDRLEAALLFKATSMLAVESSSKLCIQGNLRYKYRSMTKSWKVQHVEVHIHEGELETNDLIAGRVLILYSDSKEAQTFNRWWVNSVVVDESATNDLTFTVRASRKGSEKELVFQCENIEEKNKWIKSIERALAQVKVTDDFTSKLFSMSLEFKEKKLGFRVAESVIDESEFDYKKNDEDAKWPVNFSYDVQENIEEKDLVIAERVVGKVENLNEEAKSKEIESRDTVEDPPCKLTVCTILNESLTAAGLTENCVVSAINGNVIVGKTFPQQLELLLNTPRPITLTFTGQKTFKQKSFDKQGYSSILSELVAYGENAAKKAFYELVKGTTFEKELESSNDQTAAISALLNNQQKLLAVLQSRNVQEMEL